MKTAVCNLELYQGNDDIYVLKFEDVDNDGNKTQSDLTGYYFFMAVKAEITGDALAELSTGNGCIRSGILNEEGSFEDSEVKPYVIRLQFPHEFTETLQFPKYVYDLFGIKKDGTREVLMKGSLDVSRSVSYGSKRK